jgi:hypothetical protein
MGNEQAGNACRPSEEQQLCPACEGRRVKVVLPRRGLVVAPAGESGVLEPERDVCSLCAGSGSLPENESWFGVGGVTGGEPAAAWVWVRPWAR